MSNIEREIKILNVDAKRVMLKMKELGVKPKGKYIQDIYTFNFPTVNDDFNGKLQYALNTGGKEPLLDLLEEIKACFTTKDLELIKTVLGTKDIVKYVSNAKVEDLKLLDNSKVHDLMKKVNKNYSKWIRLRQTVDETTITIKKIVNSNGEYNLDDVKELEFSVPSIDDGKEFLKTLGYYPSLHQRKMRIAYDYNKTEVVIDKWPKIPTYLEVEGKTKEEIYEVVNDLGFKSKDVRVLNTDDVYKERGLDIYSFKDLDFSDIERKEVNELLEFEDLLEKQD